VGPARVVNNQLFISREGEEDRGQLISRERMGTRGFNTWSQETGEEDRGQIISRERMGTRGFNTWSQGRERRTEDSSSQGRGWGPEDSTPGLKGGIGGQRTAHLKGEDGDQRIQHLVSREGEEDRGIIQIDTYSIVQYSIRHGTVDIICML
jgi:hypothetical protein